MMQDTNYEMNMTQLFREKSEDKYSRIKKGRNKKEPFVQASAKLTVNFHACSRFAIFEKYKARKLSYT